MNQKCCKKCSVFVPAAVRYFCKEPTCPCHQPTKSSWETDIKQKINSLLNDYCVSNGVAFLDTVDIGYGIYELFQSELSSQKQRMVGELENAKYKDWKQGNPAHRASYDDALDTAINIIKES